MSACGPPRALWEQVHFGEESPWATTRERKKCIAATSCTADRHRNVRQEGDAVLWWVKSESVMEIRLLNTISPHRGIL